MARTSHRMLIETFVVSCIVVSASLPATAAKNRRSWRANEIKEISLSTKSSEIRVEGWNEPTVDLIWGDGDSPQIGTAAAIAEEVEPATVR